MERLTTDEIPSKKACRWFEVTAPGPGRLRLAGELDLAGAPLLRAALAEPDGDIVVDCSGLTFIDCSGLSALLGARQACERAGVRLSLLAIPRCLTRLLELAGLEEWFDIRHGSEA